MLLPGLSTSTIKRINNVAGSIKTKLLSTCTPFVKLTKVFIFLRTPTFASVIGRLSIDCCNICTINSALLQLISRLSFAVKPVAKLLNPEFVVSNESNFSNQL